jgi:uncharacterized membrane protein YvbJ
MIDEDPSDEDLDRFAGEIGYCPDCGEEVWDEAYQCPHCESVIEGRIGHAPVDRAASLLSAKTVIVLVALIVLVLVLMQIR